MSDPTPIHIIGAGLAGSEAAWQAAEAGAKVVLYEMRPTHKTEAHHSGDCAELVCSNSFRSDDATSNAVGVLHEEMRRMGSLIMRCADNNKLPAGGALAVDRERFAAEVTGALKAHPNVEFRTAMIDALPPKDWGNVIIATGPLTAAPLASAIHEATGEDALAFFDAIAPIIEKDSINFDIAWRQSRYDKVGPGGDGADYINCPLDEDQYAAFIDALLSAEQTPFKEWEKNTPYFEACLPIEVMAGRGPETLRFGPMKPVGLTNPATGGRAHAVVQLRQDNALDTLYNMVGFQTKMKYGAQAEVFRMIPGLENARFARLGGIHRNTFLNAPKVLDETLRLKSRPHIRFAGQITGVEGYLESAATGLIIGRYAAADSLGHAISPPPTTTGFGALMSHLTGGHLSNDAKQTFQPMNVNFGLFAPIDVPRTDENGKRLRGKERGFAKKRALAARALRDVEQWKTSNAS